MIQAPFIFHTPAFKMALNPEQACVCAAIALESSQKEVTAEAIAKIVKSQNIQVNPQWPVVIAEFVKTNPILGLIDKLGKGGPAPASSGAGAAPKAEEKKEESEEEIVAGFGFGDSDSD